MNTCKLNCKELIKLTLITFAVIFVTDFIIHGKLLASMYKETASLWRTEEEMKSMMMLMVSGQFLIGLFFSWIFLHGYKNTGVMEGVRYGLLFGGYVAGFNLIMHSVHPYPTALTVAWIVCGWIQLVICGAGLAKFSK